MLCVAFSRTFAQYGESKSCQVKNCVLLAETPPFERVGGHTNALTLCCKRVAIVAASRRAAALGHISPQEFQVSDDQALTPPTPPSDDPEYIIDDIMPAHEIHLLGGPSGAGKTTLAFQMIMDIRSGRPVFGHDSHPVPICYASCDRSSDSAVRTASRVGVNINIPTVIARRGHRTIRQVIDAAKELVPGLRLLVIDAIGTLVPCGKINDYGTVMDFLGYCTELCEQHHITILAMGHATKTREGEGFIRPRHKFLGSVASASCDTMFYIESPNPQDPDDPSRRIIVLPRNYPSCVLAYTFNALGRLIEISQADEELTLDVKILVRLPIGEEVTTATLYERGLPTPHRTVDRWIAEAVQSSQLERAGRGHFAVPDRVDP